MPARRAPTKVGDYRIHKDEPLRGSDPSSPNLSHSRRILTPITNRVGELQ